MNLKNIIFDLSGTLVDDLPPVLNATNTVLREMGMPEFSRDEFRKRFYLPFTKFYAELLPGVDMVELTGKFRQAFVDQEDNVEEIPYALDFLRFVKKNGIQTFLFSSIHQAHFEKIKVKIDIAAYLDHPYVEIWDKKSRILEIVKKHAIKPEETLFIGDMVHDVETAQYAKMHSCAVLTGYTHLGPLQKCNPELLLDNLSVLKELVSTNGFDWDVIVSKAKELNLNQL
jgi:phosphoglycolate phosphatase-like HAD superfamily hydrolase